jgi:hypothetical protein
MFALTLNERVHKQFGNCLLSHDVSSLFLERTIHAGRIVITRWLLDKDLVYVLSRDTWSPLLAGVGGGGPTRPAPMTETVCLRQLADSPASCLNLCRRPFEGQACRWAVAMGDVSNNVQVRSTAPADSKGQPCFSPDVLERAKCWPSANHWFY